MKSEKRERSIVKNKEQNKVKIGLIALTGLFAALITVMTAYICHIPIPIAGGYVHFGDSLIYLAATILPKPYAMLAGAIGGGMADLLTAPLWTIPTVFVKMAITIPFSNKGNKIVCPRNVIAIFLAYFISATGYFIANRFVFGSEVAFLTSVAGSTIQSMGSGVFFVIFAIALDRLKFKQSLMEVR